MRVQRTRVSRMSNLHLCCWRLCQSCHKIRGKRGRELRASIEPSANPIKINYSKARRAEGAALQQASLQTSHDQNCCLVVDGPAIAKTLPTLGRDIRRALQVFHIFQRQMADLAINGEGFAPTFCVRSGNSDGFCVHYGHAENGRPRAQRVRCKASLQTSHRASCYLVVDLPALIETLPTLGRDIYRALTFSTFSKEKRQIRQWRRFCVWCFAGVLEPSQWPPKGFLRPCGAWSRSTICSSVAARGSPQVPCRRPSLERKSKWTPCSGTHTRPGICKTREKPRLTSEDFAAQLAYAPNSKAE